jgi:hypothetical protein
VPRNLAAAHAHRQPLVCRRTLVLRLSRLRRRRTRQLGVADDAL